LQQVIGAVDMTKPTSPQKAHALRQSLQLDAVLLTRSEDGMTLV
jgi:bifunctional ADP-heptose synthase (sugar kinase/adenylyltransferase)